MRSRLDVKPLEPIPPIDPVYILDELDGRRVDHGDLFTLHYFGNRYTFKVILDRPIRVLGTQHGPESTKVKIHGKPTLPALTRPKFCF